MSIALTYMSKTEYHNVMADAEAGVNYKPVKIKKKKGDNNE